MLAVTTIFYIVHIISSFFAQQTQGLSTGDMEMMLTSTFVTVHASSNFGLCIKPSAFTNITALCREI